MGNEGKKITAPDGKSQDLLPTKHNISKGSPARPEYTAYTKMPTWNAVRWLNEKTDWVDQINRRLSMEAFEPSVTRTRDDTGSCPVCFQNVKAKPHIALHGYLRPGRGSIHGRCDGSGWLPFEVSVDGTKNYLTELEKGLAQTLERIMQLKAGEVKLIRNRFNKIIEPTSPHWAATVEGEIKDSEHKAADLKHEIEVFKKLVHHWKLRPLPKEGDRHIDWYSKGQQG